MLIESVEYTAKSNIQALGGDHVFRYCEFEGVDLDESVVVSVEGVFLGCKFSNVEMYWTLLNSTVFVDCAFVGCSFRGVSFASCRVVGCTFSNCAFVDDNLGGPCRFEETLWYGSTQNGCKGLSETLVPLGV